MQQLVPKKLLGFYKRPLPGQDSSPLEEPGHEAPPFRGAGLLHFLVLLFFIVEELHELHDPHLLHSPFTRKY